MESSPSSFYFWRAIPYNTSDSLFLNVQYPTPPLEPENFDIHTFFDVHLQSQHEIQLFFPGIFTNRSRLHVRHHTQVRLSRDQFSSSHESIRASTMRQALISSIPADVSSFIDTMVPAVSSDALLTANSSLLSMGLVMDLVFRYDHEREVLERVLSESAENNSTLRFMRASKCCIDGLKRVRVRVEDDVEEPKSMGDCTICLEKYSIGEEVIRLPCKHVFHGDCILKWLENSHLCPLCRFSMFIDE